MNKKIFKAIFTIGFISAFISCEKEKVPVDKITFEEINLGDKGFYNGSDMAGGFISGNAFFKTNYYPEYNSWSGFACSNHTDTETRGYQNQYSCIAGEGANGSSQYAILSSWDLDTLEFIVPEKITAISFCNSTYAYYSMLEGDEFAKQFGGGSGDDLDYFSLRLQCYDESNRLIGDGTINLADYRFTNNADDYIANVWTEMDLSEIGFIKYIVFSFESSDNGPFGINTPTYVCIDNIKGELQE